MMQLIRWLTICKFILWSAHYDCVGLIWFVLFKDTWSQSCMAILFLNLQIIRSDIRPHIKWAVSLVIAHGHFKSSSGVLCEYVWVNILTLSPPRGYDCMGDVWNYPLSRFSVSKFDNGTFLWSCLACLHWTSHEILGHFIVRNITKFQNCKSGNIFFIDEKPSPKHFDKNTMILY